jgi:hypothetical protein
VLRWFFFKSTRHPSSEKPFTAMAPSRTVIGH